MCARCRRCPMILCVCTLARKHYPSSLRWLELKADTSRQKKSCNKHSRWQYSVRDARCARTLTKMSGSLAQRHLGRLRALGSVARSPASERPDSTLSPQYHLSVVIGVLSCCHVAFCSFALTSSVAASSGTPFGSLSARHLRRSRVLADALGKDYMCARGCKSSPACCAASAQQLPRERSPFAPARNPKRVNTSSRAFLLSSGNNNSFAYFAPLPPALGPSQRCVSALSSRGESAATPSVLVHAPVPPSAPTPSGAVRLPPLRSLRSLPGGCCTFYANLFRIRRGHGGEVTPPFFRQIQKLKNSEYQKVNGTHKGHTNPLIVSLTPATYGCV